MNKHFLIISSIFIGVCGTQELYSFQLSEQTKQEQAKKIVRARGKRKAKAAEVVITKKPTVEGPTRILPHLVYFSPHARVIKQPSHGELKDWSGNIKQYVATPGYKGTDTYTFIDQEYRSKAVQTAQGVFIKQLPVELETFVEILIDEQGNIKETKRQSVELKSDEGEEFEGAIMLQTLSKQSGEETGTY